jgi:hypothetical protein
MVLSAPKPADLTETHASTTSGGESLGGFLAREQRARGLSDDQFAAELGVSVREWAALRESRQAWPAVTLARVLQRFPEALGLASEEVRRRIEPGNGWRWWHAAAA